MERVKQNHTNFSRPVALTGVIEGETAQRRGYLSAGAPYLDVHHFYDFTGSVPTYTVRAPLIHTTGNADINIIDLNAADVSSCAFVVPRAGLLVSAQVTAQDALAANDTNYVTFTLVNTLASGSGSTAMLAATDANTTKATGGVAITAVVGRSLTVHGTAANLRVAAGDVVVATVTTTGTLANVVDTPAITLTFETIDNAFTPLIARTAGSPLIQTVADTANGEVVCQLSATNEVNTAAIYFGDQLNIPATRKFYFEAMVKVGTIAANERAVIGLASAYNATWDSIASNLWFRHEADMDLLIEGDDGTTDTDDEDTGRDTTAGTYYLFTIDGTDGLSAVNFFRDNDFVGDISVPALTVSSLLQPLIGVQKASGTGVPSITVDWVHIRHSRS
jgi:hypothetical protein